MKDNRHDEAGRPGRTAAERAAIPGGAALAGAIVLVTGGGRGLGEAICEVLSEAGATVVVADFQRETAEAVAERLERQGRQARAMNLDVRDQRQAEGAVRSIVEQWGRVDVLVNNAATDMTVSVEELQVGDWDRILDTNLRGPFLMSKFVFPVMREQGGGHIVNVVSTAAKRVWPNAAAYHASQWGLLGLSRALHAEGWPHGIKVTAVLAGSMRTPFLLDRFPDIDLRDLQDPRNVAQTVRFVLTQPAETVIPEIMVLPMRETSWP